MGTSPTMSRSEELGAFPIKKLVSLEYLREIIASKNFINVDIHNCGLYLEGVASLLVFLNSFVCFFFHFLFAPSFLSQQ